MTAPKSYTPTPLDILGAPAGRAQRSRLGPSGNTPIAERIAEDARRVVRQAVAYNPRTLQKALGPSEIGSVCDRQIVGKMVGAPEVNNVADPWPSFVGTAGHAALADAFELDNVLATRELARQADLRTDAPDEVLDSAHQLERVLAGKTRLPPELEEFRRWITETRVKPLPDEKGGHDGTADLYDTETEGVWDHKFLGEESMNKVRRGVPPLKYVVQLGLYGMGYVRAGRVVKRVGIIAYPRTGSSVDGIYAHEISFDATLFRTVLGSLQDLERRKVIASSVLTGKLSLAGVPMVPNDDCYYCPFYRYGQPTDGAGCAGRYSPGMS